MKATVSRRYGPPDVVTVAEVPRPEPRDDEILVRVRAAAVGVVDGLARRGSPWYARAHFGLRRPRFPVLGCDFAGDVEATGPGVSRFGVGEAVFGTIAPRFGVHAEYVCLPERGAVAPCPSLIPMADADDVRRLALALPHVEEIDSDGFDFRVGGKGFVWSYPERQPGQPRVLRTDIAVLYVGDEAEKQALLLGEPAVFFTTPGYDGWPLVMLRLDEVDAGRLAELVTDAWRMRAPAELAADFEAAGG
jgi:hypothetical protein